MTATRLPIWATAFGFCMLGMLSFVLCVVLWAMAHVPICHALLVYTLPGFPMITPLGVILGLILTGVIGIYAGAVFAAFFNLWNWVLGRLNRTA